MTTRQKKLFLAIAIAVIATLFGMWFNYNTSNVQDQNIPTTATIFKPSRTITPFELKDNKSKPFTVDNLKNHWSLIFFGFSNCPDLCPTTLATLNEASKIWQADHVKPFPQVIFISVDPERDTPTRLASYLKNFNPGFIGVTGDQAALKQLTQELSVVYAKVLQEKHYSIDHSGTIIITNPRGEFYGVFTTPHDGRKIAKDMEIIMSSES